MHKVARRWLNLVLIALVLGLGGMAWWFTQQPVNGPQTLWSSDPARIQMLTLGDTTLIRCKNCGLNSVTGNGGWWLRIW
ncbi:MAG: hypothetical protein R3E89_04040 [Thiolinea sp.]